jgi:hypothetical protein
MVKIFDKYEIPKNVKENTHCTDMYHLRDYEKPGENV